MTGVAAYRVVCPRCKRSFANEQGLRVHCSSKHNFVPKAIEGSWFKKNLVDWPRRS